MERKLLTPGNVGRFGRSANDNASIREMSTDAESVRVTRFHGDTVEINGFLLNWQSLEYLMFPLQEDTSTFHYVVRCIV